MQAAITASLTNNDKSKAKYIPTPDASKSCPFSTLNLGTVKFNSLDSVFTAFTALNATPGATSRAGAVGAVSTFLDQAGTISNGIADLQSQADGRRLRECLESLEEKNRSGILLAFVHGLSHSQVAERLSMPLGTVKAWIRRGLLQLRDCMS